MDHLLKYRNVFYGFALFFPITALVCMSLPCVLRTQCAHFLVFSYRIHHFRNVRSCHDQTICYKLAAFDRTSSIYDISTEGVPAALVFDFPD